VRFVTSDEATTARPTSGAPGYLTNFPVAAGLLATDPDPLSSKVAIHQVRCRRLAHTSFPLVTPLPGALHAAGVLTRPTHCRQQRHTRPWTPAHTTQAGQPLPGSHELRSLPSEGVVADRERLEGPRSQLVAGLPLPSAHVDGRCSPTAVSPVRFGMNSVGQCTLPMTQDALASFCRGTATLSLPVYLAQLQQGAISPASPESSVPRSLRPPSRA
jgi:hypothetical protein